MPEPQFKISLCVVITSSRKAVNTGSGVFDGVGVELGVMGTVGVGVSVNTLVGEGVGETVGV